MRRIGNQDWLRVRVLKGVAAVVVVSLAGAAMAAGSRVTFGAGGTTYVNGLPFFPVGIFTYSLDGNVLADIHEQQFNTVITLNPGHSPSQLDTLHAHGLMAICPTSEQWFPAVKDHPALLAWYMTDEPEGHGNAPESERDRYLRLKKQDPDHPIGLCHFLWEALEKYKDACDFTMTDVYPITANRDVPITHVGLFMDEARRIHGKDWPHWTYIQDFGGPDTEGGKWAQPLPHEVRCMAYIALVHRANGILYFSYWPKAPRTWESIGPLNREIHRIAPWLLAPGEELSATSSDKDVQVRARKVGKGGIIIAVNTGSHFTDAAFTLSGVRNERLALPFEPRTVSLNHGKLRDRFGPYETRVYTWGSEPDHAMFNPGK